MRVPCCLSVCVCIPTDQILFCRYSYGIRAGRSGIRFPAVQDFSLLHSVQTGTEVHADTVVPEVKRPGA
jgi:hypothetical protein